jgi:hypothetical protein
MRIFWQKMQNSVWKWKNRKKRKDAKFVTKMQKKLWDTEDAKALTEDLEDVTEKLQNPFPSLGHLIYPHMNAIGWRELNGNENVSSDNFLINYDLSSDNKLLLRSHNRIQYVLIYTSTTFFTPLNETWWSAFLSFWTLFLKLILVHPSMKDEMTWLYYKE